MGDPSRAVVKTLCHSQGDIAAHLRSYRAAANPDCTVQTTRWQSRLACTSRCAAALS